MAGRMNAYIRASRKNSLPPFCLDKLASQTGPDDSHPCNVSIHWRNEHSPHRFVSPALRWHIYVPLGHFSQCVRALCAKSHDRYLVIAPFNPICIFRCLPCTTMYLYNGFRHAVLVNICFLFWYCLSCEGSRLLSLEDSAAENFHDQKEHILTHQWGILIFNYILKNVLTV